MQHQTKLLPIDRLIPNDGRIDGLPKNPRFIRDAQFEKLVRSIRDDPEMMGLRECIVFPIKAAKKTDYVVIAGNMRHRACKELGHEQIPCKILDPETPVEKLKAIAVKDNVSFGEWDTDDLANDWQQEELAEWGVGVAQWHQPSGSAGVDHDDNDRDLEPSTRTTGPRASDDEYSVYEQVMLHENKKELLEVLNKVKDVQQLDKLEDALMYLVRFYSQHK